MEMKTIRKDRLRNMEHYQFAIPLIPAFEREIGSAPGSLSFTGEVKGSGKDRRFKFYDHRTKVWTWGKLRADGTLAPWVG